jgi:hypothetical protein
VTAVENIEKMKAALAESTFDACIINGKMAGFATVEETHRWMIENAPSLTGHFLFTFASLADPEVRGFLDANHVPFLVKPFEIGDLIANTRKLLPAKTKSAAAGT